MPCTLTGSLDGDRAYIAEESNAAAQEKVIKLTRLLCEAMNHLDSLKSHPFATVRISKQLERWWRNHQKIDARRKEEEARAKRRKEKA